MTSPGPVLIGYDGSKPAKVAITRAGALLPGRHAVVVNVWAPIAAVAAVLGSTAEGVLSHAHRPVVLVPGD